MSYTDLEREARFLLRRPAALALIGFFGAISGFSVASGLAEVRAQRETLSRLLQMDARERAEATAGRSDYGEVAYHGFHLTYDPPSDQAFAALGQRDVFPWKHRVRMLALEGQIRETDAAKPELAPAGAIDFAFVVAFLLPLGVILLLHDILLTQREAVNDAWDLLKKATMEPCVARHPQRAHASEVEQPFEWKGYYAFQQVGGQAAEALSEEHRQGTAARDRASGYAALLSPPALVQRALSRLADTDVEAALDYERRVREFHAELRAFYYPLLFEQPAFDPAVLADLPEFRIEGAG